MPLLWGVASGDYCYAIAQRRTSSSKHHFPTKVISGRDTGGAGEALPPPHFLRWGALLFLRTEQFNLKLEVFLAIHHAEDGGGF